MPAQQRIRLNDVQRIFPVRYQPSQTDRLDAIPVRELRSFLTTFENNQLLAKQRVFDKQVMLLRARSMTRLPAIDPLAGLVICLMRFTTVCATNRSRLAVV